TFFLEAFYREVPCVQGTAPSDDIWTTFQGRTSTISTAIANLADSTWVSENITSDTALQGLAHYDIMVNRYGKADFLNRHTASGGLFNLFGNQDGNSNSGIIAAAIAAGVITIGVSAILVCKKKKHSN
ncbi:MAG: hypothetical protein K5694_01455, partial [Bacilli bacterium]|nr:hypothetical protein [Bacilli bacterium]